MSSVIIRQAAKEDLLALCDLDFTWEATGRFDVHSDGLNIRLTEQAYEQPVMRGMNEQYHEEIRKYATYCDQADALMLVAITPENKPVGYISSFIEEWQEGLVINADGILVSREYRNQGIAKALLVDLIQRAGETEKCRGIMIEMDTEKYEANRLLLSMGFVFAGTRFFIRGNEAPKPGSKEALYFYYAV